MAHQRFVRVLHAVAIAAMLCTAWPVAHAQTSVTWDGSDSTTWSNGQNWLGGTAPAWADYLIFSTAGSLPNQPSNNTTSGTYGSLTFLNNTFTGPLTLGGESLTLSPVTRTGVTMNRTSASATVTVTRANHGLTTGQMVQFGFPGFGNASGAYTITVVDANTFTYTSGGSGNNTTTSGTYTPFTLYNANTTAGRDVTIGNNLVIDGAQRWMTANTSNGVTIISGNLSGAGNLFLTSNASSSGNLPNFRLTGNNSGYTGEISFSTNGHGVLLGNANAMTGGAVSLGTQSSNLWLTGGASSGTYTFGIVGSSATGPRVGFKGDNNTGGLALTGGDVYWNPGGGSTFTWNGTGGAGNTNIEFAGSNDSTPRTLFLGTVGGTFSITAADKGFRAIYGSGNNPGRVTLLSSLSDGNDVAQRTLTTSLPLLTLSAAAVNGSNPLRLTVSPGSGTNAAVQISNVNQLPTGNLTLAGTNATGSVLILDNVNNFNRKRGSSNGEYQFVTNNALVGFAAQGSSTIPNTPGNEANFDTNFGIGYYLLNSNNTLVATGSLTIAQDTTLTAARTIRPAGNGVIAVVASGTTFWTGPNVLNRFSGNLSGANGSLIVTSQTNASGWTGRLVLAGTNTWGGAPTLQLGTGTFMNVGAGGLIANGAFVQFSGNASFPTNDSTPGTSYISAQSSGASTAAGLLLTGAASGTTTYQLPTNRRFLLGTTVTGTLSSSLVTSFGAEGGRAQVQGSTMLLNGPTSSGTTMAGLVVPTGSELTLGASGNPFTFIPTSGIDASASGSATVYGEASGGRILTKLGEGTLVLNNVAYTNLAGTGSTASQFQWRLGRHDTKTNEPPAGPIPALDGAVRGLAPGSDGANASNSLLGGILMRGGVYEIDNTSGNADSYTANVGANSGTFIFGSNGGGGFAAFGRNVALTLSNNSWGSLFDNQSTGGRGPLMFGSRTANAVISLTNGLAWSGGSTGPPTITVIDNPDSSADYAAITGTMSGRVNSGYSFTKAGDGLLELSAANTFPEPTVVQSGTLRLANNAALQNSPLNTSGTGVVVLTSLVTTPTFGGLIGSKNLSDVITSGYGNVTQLTLNSGSNASTYTGTLSNGASGMSVRKTGTSTQRLGGVNTYTGTTFVDAGVLELGVSGTLTGNISNAATLRLFPVGSTSGVASGTITGAGSLAITDGGTLRLTNASSSYTGKTTIASGVLEVESLANAGSNSPLGAPTGANATIDLGSATTSGTLRYIGSGNSSSDRSLSLLNNGGIEANGSGALTISGSVSSSASTVFTLTGTSTALNTIGRITGPGVSVVKDGSGVWRMNGSSTPFGGTLAVKNGTLWLATDTALPSSVITVGDAAGSGTAAFLLEQTVTNYTNDFLLPSGGSQTVLIGGTNGSSFGFGQIRMGRGVTLVASTGGTVGFANNWRNADSTGDATQNVTIGASGYAGRVLLDYNGQLATTGTLAVELGTAAIGVDTTIDPTTPVTVGSSLGAATFELNNVVTHSFRDLSFLGNSGSIVSGVLGLGESGSPGTVNVTGNDHLISSAVTLNDNATFNVNAASRLLVSSEISGGGRSLTKSGAGILELTGSNSYDGTTTVSAGRLLVNGRLESSAVTVQSGGLLGGSGFLGTVSVLAGGTFSPGNSPGLLTASTLTLGGVTLMEIDGLTRGTLYDAADVAGQLAYGGSMLIDFGSFATAALPDNTSFNLFDFGSYTGGFGSITTAEGGSWYAGLTFSGTGDKRTATKGAQTLEFTHSTGILLIVPEPATIALAGIAAACAGLMVWRRRR